MNILPFLSKVPAGGDEFENWLVERYVEKEKMLAKYYETGVWTVPPAPGEEEDSRGPTYRTRPVRVEQDMLRMAILHSLFLCSTCFHLTIGFYLVSYLWNLIF